ncbi:uncharacterized protein [Temnothorax longispinosus]|uniref:uncharacterized protein n=1 Tax=Temnothorax longispinosus TaxID=300112 RepID=UPI003A98D7AF
MEKAYVIRKQFPITLSYGITIHKSQGLTLQNAVMDIAVKVSERAISEYNRLIRTFLPQAQTIPISKKRFRKVKDVPWTLSKIINAGQESDQQVGKSTVEPIPVLQNEDGVSCYANSVIQCFLQSSIIRKVLLKVDKDDLSILAHKYDKRLPNLNADAIRTDLGERFTSRGDEKPAKRDALEFLIAICTKYNYIRNLVGHQVTRTTKCISNSCGYTTKDNITDNIVVPISINNLKKKSYNLNNLLKDTFLNWGPLYGKTCQFCAGNLVFRNELTLTKEIVIIHLILFSSQDNKLVKIPQTFNLTGISTTKISIAKQQYKVMNTIFHQGTSIEDGHYTSMCRERTFWIEFDDGKIIENKRWPTGAKGLYILFLEKVGKK